MAKILLFGAHNLGPRHDRLRQPKIIRNMDLDEHDIRMNGMDDDDDNDEDEELEQIRRRRLDDDDDDEEDDDDDDEEDADGNRLSRKHKAMRFSHAHEPVNK